MLDRDLVRGLSEKEVEIEHLRTQVFALQEKAEVLNDMRVDVQANKDLLRSSEDRRYEMQQTFVRITETVRTETSDNQEDRRRLIEENQKLRDELEATRTLMGRREQEHLQFVDELNRSHQHKFDTLAQNHFDADTAQQNAHLAQLEKLQGEHKSKIEQLT